jgi:hypothetical protein
MSEMETFQVEEITQYPGWEGNLFGTQPKRNIKRKLVNLPPSPISKKFVKNWELFTCNAFAGVKWSNIVVAGGAVLGPLMSGRIENYDEI